MDVVLIDSQPYEAYATVDDADLYLAASIHAASWTSASEATKAQALVTATRVLDRQTWKAAYDTQAERAVVEDIVNASIEMALALVDGSELQSEQNTSQKLQSIKAGSVSLTYFRGAEGVAHRFPLIVVELLRLYLAGTTPALGSGMSSGTDGTSGTDDDFGYSEGI